MQIAGKPLRVVAFSTPLGWMALVSSGGKLHRLVFGHASRSAAIEALDSRLTQRARPDRWNEPLVARLEAYAAGQVIDFRDVRIEIGHLSDFQRRVVRQCRRVGYAQTVSYGELAARAGSPRAARAVGQCMAANRFPLIVPCHRVVAAGGRLGKFSAPGGTRMKQRLLAMEAARVGNRALGQ